MARDSASIIMIVIIVCMFIFIIVIVTIITITIALITTLLLLLHCYYDNTTASLLSGPVQLRAVNPRAETVRKSKGFDSVRLGIKVDGGRGTFPGGPSQLTFPDAVSAFGFYLLFND